MLSPWAYSLYVSAAAQFLPKQQLRRDLNEHGEFPWALVGNTAYPSEKPAEKVALIQHGADGTSHPTNDLWSEKIVIGSQD
jgi:hypothetical protein